MGGGDDDGRQAVRLHTELTPCDPPATVSGTATAEAVGAPSVQRKHSSADVGGLAQRPTQRGRRDRCTDGSDTHAARARPHARTHARTHGVRTTMQMVGPTDADTGSTRSRARRLGRGPMSRWRCCRHTEEACGCASAVLCCFALNEMSTAGDALPVALTQWGGLQRHVPFADRMGPGDRTRREMPLVRNAPIPCSNMRHHAINSMREHPPSNVQEASTPWLRRGGAAASNATRTCTCAMHRNARVRPTEYVLHATEQLYGTPSTLTAPMGALSTQHSDAS